ncbi:MAG: hypothetical protein J6R96_02645 [Spirochaetaceae bacterium]|nr:hypothetical protein [Spirochaetaceae bacterium]MBO5729795.1 hypothetical protein [Treponema sp.]MEE0133658.1 hypothetical protein [Treponema sp.]
MMYPYITLADETMIVHSELRHDDGKPFVEVHFERPEEQGFLSARCVLPSYKWLFNDGFSQKEIEFFTELLAHNAHTIFKYAESGGINIA